MIFELRFLPVNSDNDCIIVAYGVRTRVVYSDRLAEFTCRQWITEGILSTISYYTRINIYFEDCYFLFRVLL